MRLPSIQVAAREAGRVLAAYPFVLLAGASAAFAGLLLIEEFENPAALRLLFTSALGLPLFVTIATLGHRHGPGALTRLILPVAGVVALAGYYWASAAWFDPIAVRRFAQINLGLHALTAVAAWAGHGGSNGFWQFNRRLFERFLVSALFSAVLFVGLVLAIVSLDPLFGIDVDDDHFGRLWFLLAFVFNTWYFLGGVPSRLEELDAETAYPAGLRIFSQYILVPLVFVYLVILVSYFARVVITREWPSGWIGWLVTGVSVLGILAMLLVHPVRERPEARWVRTFARGFWFALLPALAMLFLAIGKRVDQYGITENRYLLTALAVWLTGLTFYFIFRPRGSIAAIPWSLAAVALLTSFGPWGAYAVSRADQTERLRTLLEANGLWADGRARAAEGEVSREARGDLAAVLRYLGEHHGDASFAAWLEDLPPDPEAPDPPADERDHARRERVARGTMARLGLEYVGPGHGRFDDHFNYRTDRRVGGTEVRGWDWRVEITARAGTSPPAADDPRRFPTTWDPETDRLAVWDAGEIVAEFDVGALARQAHDAYATRASEHGLPPDVLVARPIGGGDRAELRLDWIGGELGDEGPTEVGSFHGEVLVREAR